LSRTLQSRALLRIERARASDRPAPMSPGAEPAERPLALATTTRGSPARSFALRASGLPQAARLLGCAIAIGAGELAQRPFDGFAGGGARRARRRAAAARRLAHVLGELKGPFAKAGQFAALRLDVVDPEARAAFAELQDRVPPRPFGEIAATVEAELGLPLDAVFAEFERAPLGAASIAQVHRARLVSGETVAVKVQYPWLARSLPADLAIARRLLRLLTPRRNGSKVDREQLFGEFAAGLAEELDFEREARVAAEIAANLAHDAQIVVPTVHRELSTRRVLVMSWIPAIPIGDHATLAARGVPIAEIVATLARAYAKQIFADGLFHADPHPGNLFVIDEPDAAFRPRILFIDFGLAKRLDPALRRELRTGIHALLRRDVEAFLDGMERMGMIAPGARDGVRAAVAGMFERIAAQGQVLGLGGGQVLALKDHAKVLLEETPGLQLPNDLLLYAKTLSYLFAVGTALDPSVDLMKLTVPYLLRFLADRS
jgi:predicted unusual protein kinase regulating ubiquinone biosynthesis (AarF/ABC1/UbiB family)